MADQVRHVRQLDFSKFLAGNPTEKSDFCREFVHDLSQVGFVKLTNHGIPPDQIRGVFHWVSRDDPSSIEPALRNVGGCVFCS